MKVGLRQANQHFSRMIKAVRAGKEVVLTERGRPMAVIKPLSDMNDLGDEEAALRAMADEGLIIPAPRRGAMPAPRWRPIRVQGRPVSQTILDDREDA